MKTLNTMVYESDANLVANQYKELLKKRHGAKYVKCNLHVHSPGSNDYKGPGETEKEKYQLFVDAIIKAANKHNLRVIAITDHNTFDGYKRICRELHHRRSKGEPIDLKVIPGIEITTTGVHIIGLFRPPKYSELNNFVANLEEDLLISELKIRRFDFGSKIATTRCTIEETIANISKMKGYAVAPHPFIETGILCRNRGNKTDLKNAFRSINLSALQISNQKDEERLIHFCSKDPEWKRANVPLIFRSSDCHDPNSTSNSRLDNCFWLKCDDDPFTALELAFIKGYKTERTDILNWHAPNSQKSSFFVGIAFERGKGFLGANKDWNYIRFSKGMNILYGERGTGKTTILEWLRRFGQSDPRSEGDHEAGSSVLGFYKNIFIYYQGNYGKAHTVWCYQIKSENEALPKDNHINFWKSIGSGDNLRFYDCGLSKFDCSPKLYWSQHEIADLDKQENILDFFDKQVLFNMLGFRPPSERELINSLKPRTQSLKIITKKRAQLTSDRASIIRSVNKFISNTGIEINYIPEGNKKDFENILQDIESLFRDKILGHQNKEQLENELNNLMMLGEQMGPQKFYLYVKSPHFRKEYFHIHRYFYSWVIEHEVEKLWSTPIYDLIKITSKTNPKGKPKDVLVLSGGQKASVLLQLLLLGLTIQNDNPILLDQPEADLDTRYVYSSISETLIKLAATRQIIFATHSPQLPVPLQPDNCYHLDVKDGHAVIKAGYIDNRQTLENLRNVLEGGSVSFEKRAKVFSLLSG